MIKTDSKTLIARDRIDSSKEFVDAIQGLLRQWRQLQGAGVIFKVVNAARAGKNDIHARFVAAVPVGGFGE
jgi:hypothetical protein